MKRYLSAVLMCFILFLSVKAHGQYLEIRSSKLCLRLDLTRGGAICHISKRGSERNLVNTYDEGRYIQQSYYAGKSVNRQSEGQSPTWSPWPWNPIQVGDYARNRAPILEKAKRGNTLYVKCIPMLWDMNNQYAEAIMEQWTTLRGNIIKVKNRLTCHRTDSLYGEGVEISQEIPAVYPISSLCRLYGYFGSRPFTYEKMDTTEVKEIIIGDPEHFWGRYPDVPEKWMAFTDKEGWGMGIYSPSAMGFLAGRFLPDRNGESADAATSYIAPLRNERLMKTDVMEYEYYIIIDKIDHIRKKIYRIQAKQH